LPKIEIKTFDGEILNWLGWWAQFQKEKIHDDEELHDSDSFSISCKLLWDKQKD